MPVRDYRSADRAAFEACNRWWLERWYAVEPIDERYFADPDAMILRKGGRIFVAERDGEIFGVCALIPGGAAGSMELAKMGVLPAAQGRGVGRALVAAALSAAAEMGLSAVWLLTSSALQAAAPLYRSFGFRDVPLTDADRATYKRADVRMEYLLGNPPVAARG